MRAYEFLAEDKDTLKLPDMNVGDEVKVGRFKNRKAEIKGFKKDDHGQPVLKTTKGDQKLFKPRISKLEPDKKLNESLDTSVYGSWILPNREIVAVEDHITFLLDYYNYREDDMYDVEPENQDKLMDRALDDGLVRIVTSNYPKFIEFHARKEILKKTFKLWWKSAIAADVVVLDIDPTYTTSHRYKMPAEKEKLRQLFIQAQNK